LFNNIHWGVSCTCVVGNCNIALLKVMTTFIFISLLWKKGSPKSPLAGDFANENSLSFMMIIFLLVNKCFIISHQVREVNHLLYDKQTRLLWNGLIVVKPNLVRDIIKVYREQRSGSGCLDLFRHIRKVFCGIRKGTFETYIREQCEPFRRNVPLTNVPKLKPVVANRPFARHQVNTVFILHGLLYVLIYI
jgi:hypothetical protein